MRRSHDITVCLSTDELPEYDAQLLLRSAPTLYAALPIPLAYKTGFRGRAPLEKWQEKENRKWALWDLARAKRRLGKRSRENIITLLPSQSIEELSTDGAEAGPSEKEIAQISEREIPSERETSEKQGPQKRERALVTGPDKKAVTLTQTELEMLFSAAWALSQEKYRRIKTDYDEFTAGKGFLRNSRDDDFRVPRIRNLHFDMDIVLSEINGFNDPHIILSILNVMYGGSCSHSPSPIGVRAHIHPQPRTRAYGTRTSRRRWRSGCGGGRASRCCCRRL